MKKYVWNLLCLLVLLPSVAFGAVERSGTTTTDYDQTTYVLHTSHEVTVGTDLLVVIVGAKPGAADTTCTIGVTWSGTSMTLLDSTLSSDDAYVGIFYKTSPAAETADVDTNITTSEAIDLIHIIVNYAGVDTGDPFGVAVTDNALNGTSINEDVACTVGDYILGACTAKSNTSIICGEAEFADTTSGGQPLATAASEDTSAASNPLNVNFSWSTNSNNAMIGVPINASSASAAVRPKTQVIIVQ